MGVVRKAVITAAGRGTRQYPATASIQKELFPLIDVDGYAKPTLQIIVEEAFASGVEEVCIIANPGNVDAIRQHFRGLTRSERVQFGDKPWLVELSDQLDAMAGKLTFVVQETQEGYGHAVYQARGFVSDEPFLMMLGDHIYLSDGQRCAKQVLHTYSHVQAPIVAVVPTQESNVPRYGIVGATPLPNSSSTYRVTHMMEKPDIEAARKYLRVDGLPEEQYLTFFGINVLTPDIFDCLQFEIDHDLREKGEFQFTSALNLLMQRSQLLAACTVEGDRYDMGIPQGYVETQIALAMLSPFRQNVIDTVRSLSECPSPVQPR